MRQTVHTRTLAGVLIAAGTIIAVGSLFADRLGLSSDAAYVGPRQWLGMGLGFFIALIGVGLINREQIKECPHGNHV